MTELVVDRLPIAVLDGHELDDVALLRVARGASHMVSLTTHTTMRLQVRAKVPEDFEDFRQLCLTVARVMAGEVDGVSTTEDALERVRQPLDSLGTP